MYNHLLRPTPIEAVDLAFSRAAREVHGKDAYEAGRIGQLVTFFHDTLKDADRLTRHVLADAYLLIAPGYFPDLVHVINEAKDEFVKASADTSLEVLRDASPAFAAFSSTLEKYAEIAAVLNRDTLAETFYGVQAYVEDATQDFYNSELRGSSLDSAVERLAQRLVTENEDAPSEVRGVLGDAYLNVRVAMFSTFKGQYGVLSTDLEQFRKSPVFATAYDALAPMRYQGAEREAAANAQIHLAAGIKAHLTAGNAIERAVPHIIRNELDASNGRNANPLIDAYRALKRAYP